MAASRDGTVTLWDTVSRSPRAVIRTGTNIIDAAISADGSLVAIGDAGGEITLWSTRPRVRIGTLTGHTGPVDALAFSPDGRLLASGSQDRTVVLWQVAERRRWATLVGHESSVTAAVWSPTGTVLYTGSADKTVIPWTVRPPDALNHICRTLMTSFPEEPGCG